MSRIANAFSVSAMISEGISPVEDAREDRRFAHASSLPTVAHRAAPAVTSGPSAALTTASAAGPAVEVRSTVSPSRTASRRPPRARRAPRRRCRPRGRRRARCRVVRRSKSSAGERRVRASARGQDAGCRGPRDEVVRRRSQRRDLGQPRAVSLLRRLADDRRPARAALLGLRGIPPRDAARRLPRHDLVDAELGRRLHRELVAVALGERLHEHDPRDAAPAIVVARE